MQSSKKEGKYIAIEGLEGAGKTTAMKAVQDFFKHYEIEPVREPGGTPLAEQMRKIFKEGHPDEQVYDKTETLLVFGARNQLLMGVVIPAIEAGKIALSDRCYLSSDAYQHNDSELVNYLKEDLVIKPELIIYLDVAPEVGLERARGRGELDRIEKKNIDFFHKARAVYLEEADKHDFIHTINGEQTPEKVAQDITELLHKLYG